MDTDRPPQFDGINFPYYSARMACYLEAVNLGVWRVTCCQCLGPDRAPEVTPRGAFG
jgi:hypothetical protein